MNKLEYTQELIHCWVESWGVNNVYVAFSGGKDSTVLLDIARKLYPSITGVFNNTGLELPEITKFVKEFDNIVTLRPKMPFHKVIDKYGWPVISKEQASFIHEYNHAAPENKGRRLKKNKWGMGKIADKWMFCLDAPFKISHMCCNILKKNPAKNYEKQTGKRPMLGVMSGESQLRKQTHTCNLYDSKRPVSKPLLKWSESDIWGYIREHDLKYCVAYDQGWDRTGCIFCMYGIHKDNPNRFQMIKETHPKLYDYCINTLGAGAVLDFMKINYTATQQKLF